MGLFHSTELDNWPVLLSTQTIRLRILADVRSFNSTHNSNGCEVKQNNAVQLRAAQLQAQSVSASSVSSRCDILLDNSRE